MQKAFVRVPAFSNFIKDQLVLILKVMVVAAWNITWIRLPTCQSPIRECFVHSCAVSGALAVVEGRRVVVWPDVLGCPAAAAREHLSTLPETVPAAGLENPAALPGLCFARGGIGRLAELSGERSTGVTQHGEGPLLFRIALLPVLS